MENNEVRAVIKYLCLKEMSTKDIFANLVETLGDSAPPYSTIAHWCKEFLTWDEYPRNMTSRRPPNHVHHREQL